MAAFREFRVRPVTGEKKCSFLTDNVVTFL